MKGKTREESGRGLAILGSTGSIGTQTLEVIRLFPERFSVKVLSAGTNVDLLIEQALEFNPACVVIGDEGHYSYLKENLSSPGTEILVGQEGLCEAAGRHDVDEVVAALVGFAGLRSVLTAIEAGKQVALANKETLVVAGQLVNEKLKKHGGTLVPIDSEHSAIFQCLVGEPEGAVHKLILTASGGPFRSRPLEDFPTITRAEALNHPNWDMGAKITIDSATMMNKGLEVIEARWLFDMDADQISVLVHPESIIHSMVEFMDGSTKAQLGIPDMRVPIQYALSYPDRWPAPHPRISWRDYTSLHFESPDFTRFPCLGLAFEALSRGGSAPAILNAANEVAVDLFLKEKIHFTAIPTLIEMALGNLAADNATNLEAYIAVDQLARLYVKEHYRTAVH